MGLYKMRELILGKNRGGTLKCHGGQKMKNTLTITLSGPPEEVSSERIRRRGKEKPYF